MRVNALLALLLALSSTPTLALTPLEQVLEPYEAEYTLSWHGLSVGTSKQTLSDLGNHRFELESKTHPYIRLLPYNYYERSDFSLLKNKIVPSEYVYDHHEGSKTKKGLLELKNYPLGTQDKITHLFALRADLLAGKKEFTYPIADEKGGVERYQFHILGEETLETDIGTLNTVKLEHRSGKRVTTLWLAPSLNYLPVKLHQTRKGVEAAGGEILRYQKHKS